MFIFKKKALEKIEKPKNYRLILYYHHSTTIINIDLMVRNYQKREKFHGYKNVKSEIRNYQIKV